jgi:hypothetical protein
VTDESVTAAERTEENVPRTTRRQGPGSPRVGESFLYRLNEQIAQARQHAQIPTVSEPEEASSLQSYADVYVKLRDAAYRERVRDLVIAFAWMAVVLVVVAILALLAVAVAVAFEGSDAWRAPLIGAGGLVGLLCWTLRRMVRVAEPDSDLNRGGPSRSLLRRGSRRRCDQAN